MKREGFSLIEVLIVMLILAISATLAVPTFQQLIRQTDANRQKNAWLDYLSAGRTSAVDHASNITACPLSVQTCSDDLTGTWTMFTDGNDNRTLDEDELIIRTLQPQDRARMAIYRQDQPYFRFYNRPNGLYSGLMKSFTLCPTGNADEYAYHISVNIMGRIAVNTERDAAGVPIRKTNGSWVTVTC